MVRLKTRQKLRRYHIWLGWIVGLPILFWTVSGLVMVARPIEEVRGEDLIARGAAALARTGRLCRPPIGPRPVASVTLEQQSDGPVWLIRYADGAARRADPATGRLLPPLDRRRCRPDRQGPLYRQGAASPPSTGLRRKPPLDLRRKVEAWRVTMGDGTRFYLNAATGEILARRTEFWRFYDLMWGIHIMDPGGREDTHNPWVIGFGLVALVTTILAIIMLPMTISRRRRGK